MAQGFHYERVELYKTEVLGVGSYGAVCKARCDDLPCAAKILHSTLFQFNDPGAMHVLQKFERECYFLSAIRHPHIVQYLGTCHDPDSRLPVLLMEIMEQSLTRFLEQSKDPLPYHTQVNLCHDTALALSYLHSNDIIHRDLSSNNVLLIAGSRAKVTDFGMAKLFDINHSMTPMTMCPGTTAYMPPEALRDPPVYDKKLDCFSFGVLDIQIITRQFPKPDPAVQIVEDSRYPMGRVQVLVPETDRRRSHISLIDTGHSLLLIATDCLSYNAEDRPSAHELCHRLAELKGSTHYGESVKQAEGRAQMATTETESNDRLIRELQEEKKQHIEIIQDLQRQTKAKDSQLQEKETTIMRQLDKIKEIELQLAQKDKKIEVQEGQPIELNQSMVPQLQQSLLQKQMEAQNQQERVECLEQQLASGSKGVTIQLKWKSGGKVPEMMNRGANAVIQRVGYFKSSGSATVHACDFTTGQWSVLPECPHSDFSLVVVNNFLTAVGGELSGEPTNALLSLTGKGEWLKIYPPMPTKRFRTTAVCSKTSLVVAGGTLSIFSTDNLTTVEVMDTETLQWCTAACLPHPFPDASATICGGRVYLLGGWDEDGSETKLVLTCSLPLRSSQPTPSLADQPSVWQAVADVPVYLSTTATIKGQLLAIGGLNEDRMPTNLVHKYNPENNSWEIIGRMRIARYWPLVAALPSSELTVVGGKTKTGTWTDAVEIGSESSY